MADWTAARAIEFLVSTQNPDGGWGYAAKKSSQTEPSGLALVALNAAGKTSAASGGLAFLRSCRLESGGIGVGPMDKAGNWVSYAALLAFHILGAADDEKGLTAWILDYRDSAFRLSKDEAAEIAGRFRYDVTIPGWPWIANTVSWVEPTALLATALLHAGIDPNDRRIQLAVRLIFDRAIKTGGWNYGVPFDRMDNAALPLPSAIALLALGTAGFDESEPALWQAVEFLAARPVSEMSTVALGWTVLAFKSVKAAHEKTPILAAELRRRQIGDGSFRGNILETALACLALGGFRFTAKGRTRLQ